MKSNNKVAFRPRKSLWKMNRVFILPPKTQPKENSALIIAKRTEWHSVPITNAKWIENKNNRCKWINFLAMSNRRRKKTELNRIESKRVFNSSAKYILCGFSIWRMHSNSSNTVLCFPSCSPQHSYIGTWKWFLALELGLHSNYFSDFF